MPDVGLRVQHQTHRRRGHLDRAMKAIPAHKLCPYTLKPLAELPEVNREHIFPDSIGGGAAYVVSVDAKTNSSLGTTVDAAFVDSPLLAALRSRLGIKSRSGLSKWRLNG